MNKFKLSKLNFDQVKPKVEKFNNNQKTLSSRSTIEENINGENKNTIERDGEQINQIKFYGTVSRKQKKKNK